MIDEPARAMKDACHYLAEHIMRRPCRTNRCKWLQQQLVDLLTDQSHIDWYAKQYDKDYAYADAPTEFLASVLKAYDEEVN